MEDKKKKYNGIRLNFPLVSAGSFDVLVPLYIEKNFTKDEVTEFIQKDLDLYTKLLFDKYDIFKGEITFRSFIGSLYTSYLDTQSAKEATYIVFNYQGQGVAAYKLERMLKELRKHINDLFKEYKPKNYKPLKRKVLQQWKINNTNW